MRLAQTQVWPALRYLDAIAPLTAISMSASSKTMNGALPPNSSETFFTVPAHCSINSLPISVEPVKVSLRTVGFEVISPPISVAPPVAQDLGALLGGPGAPRRQGAVGRLDRPAGLFGAHFGHGAEGLAIGRVGDPDRLAADRIDPFAIDVAVLPEQPFVLEL